MASSTLATPGDVLYVQAEGTELRAAPEATAPVVLRLEAGRKIIEFERRGPWVRVGIFGAVGQVAWVRGSRIARRPAGQRGSPVVEILRGSDAAEQRFRLIVSGRPAMKFAGRCDLYQRSLILTHFTPVGFGAIFAASRERASAAARDTSSPPDAAGGNKRPALRVGQIDPPGARRRLGRRGAIPTLKFDIVPEARGRIVPPLSGRAMPPPLTGTMVPPLTGTMVPPLTGTMVPPLTGTMVPPLTGTMVPPLTGTMVPPLMGAVRKFPTGPRE